MGLFTDCSGECKNCQISYIGGCIAGKKDDDFVYASPEWIRNFLKKQKQKNKRKDK